MSIRIATAEEPAVASRWDIRWAQAGSKILDKLFADGWEPFAVAVHDEGLPDVYVRRVARRRKV